MLEVDALRESVENGHIDTVLVVFPDLQGRFMGKRVTGHYFCDHVIDEGVEACNYLLTVDVDMNVLPGYQFANWDQGYGDFACRPDLSTLRQIPWLDRTALVICDLHDVESGAAVDVAPRQILRRQVERAHALGYDVMAASEPSSSSSARATRRPRPRATSTSRRRTIMSSTTTSSRRRRTST
jgi:glutamine synthetase